MRANILFILAVPAVISLLSTPLVKWLAHKVGAIDMPNERKIHKHPLPRMGGVALYLGFFLSLIFFLNFSATTRSLILLNAGKGIYFLGALLLVFATGIWDDIRALNPGRKFLIQLAAATIVYIGGFRISEVTGLSGGHLELGLFDYPATVLWIVGVTNAFNLIDGLDGLASGIALIASVTIFSTSLLNGEHVTAFFVLALAGSIIGFLPYNFNPATIFLGDSGSLLLGFTLSVLSTHSSTKGSTAFAIIIPLLALGLPIMDTLLAMVRRMLRSFLPESSVAGGILGKLHSMFMPDRSHVHHQLIAMGFSHRKVVFLLYFVSCVFGVGAFTVTVTNNFDASIVLLAVGIATVVGIRHLRYKEMAILRNGMLLPLYEWPVLNRTLFQGFLDLALTVGSFLLAMSLTNVGTLANRQFFSFAVITGLIQIAAFSIFGLYRGTVRFLGIGDILRMTKCVAVAVIATGIVLSILPESRTLIPLRTFVADFYILFSLIAGLRVSYHILNYFFQREAQGGKGVLIYGAGANGILTLQNILFNDFTRLKPLGFLDDDPALEGKNINGYKVFGGHWKLGRLLKKNNVEEIVIASESMKPEILRRVIRTANSQNVKVKRSKLLLEDLPADIGSERVIPGHLQEQEADVAAARQ